MSARLLKMYHKLPAPARSAVASLRGFYLRRWRYGTATERLVEETLARDTWTAEQWRTWQEERLAALLLRAATKVPYYREMWARRRRQGDRASFEHLENWPVLSKETLRKNARALVAEDCRFRNLFHDHTSGTTGTPLDLWLSRQTVRTWYAMFEARTRRWHGTSCRQPWAILGGQPVVSAHATKPPFWVWNRALNQLYLSSNHVSRANVPAYLEALARYRATHLIAYASSVTILAGEAIRLGLKPPPLSLVLTNGEPLYPWQREMIERGLQCEVRETYGMAEIVATASECPHGTLHQWPDTGVIEVLHDHEALPMAAGESGRLVCTGLLNSEMPLIRYDVGDRGGFAVDAEPCRCGRTLPMMKSIEGRTNDVLIGPDGRYVYWVNPVFYGLPVQEAQIVQETLERTRVRYVPAPEFTTSDAAEISGRLRQRLGDVCVVLEATDRIPRQANGKFRAVICELNSEQRHAVGATL